MMSNEQEKNAPKHIIEENIVIGPVSIKKETDGLSKLILDSLNKYPDFVSQINVQTGEKITFAEMKEKSIRCAVWLLKQGVKRDDIVCISTPNRTDDYVPYLATHFIGAILNPWSYKTYESYDAAECFFNLIRPKIMFACEKSIDSFAQVAKNTNSECKFVAYGRHENFPSLRDILCEQSSEEVNNFRHVEPENAKKQVGVIFFTSGTTGIPKACMLSYDSLVHNGRDEALRGMNVLWYSPLYRGTGFSSFVNSIRLQCTRILHDNFHPEETCRVMENYKVNLAMLCPPMLTQIHASKVLDRVELSSLKIISTFGAKPSSTILEKFRKILPKVHLCKFYGMTELNGPVVSQIKGDIKNIDSAGFIYENVKMKVVDLNKKLSLGPNQQGELCFKAENFMLGYYKNPSKTDEVIDNEGWVHTGDLGYYDENGEIFILNRINHLITCQTEHIPPSLIEDILLKHPDVVDAAVVGVSHPVDIERPMAFVVKTPGAKVTADELKELPAKYNEVYRLTGGVVFVDALEYNEMAKKNVTKLKEKAELLCNRRL